MYYQISCAYDSNHQSVKRVKAPRTFLFSANVLFRLSYWMDLVSAIRAASAQSAVGSHVLTTAPARGTPISATLWKLVRPQHRHSIVAFAAVTWKRSPKQDASWRQIFSCFVLSGLLWVTKLLDVIWTLAVGNCCLTFYRPCLSVCS